MAEPTPPPDDHIEDLLSQLQGIFGRLAHSEDEESGSKPSSSSAPRSAPASTPAPPQAWSAPAPVEPPPAPPPPVVESRPLVPSPIEAPSFPDLPLPQVPVPLETIQFPPREQPQTRSETEAEQTPVASPPVVPHEIPLAAPPVEPPRDLALALEPVVPPPPAAPMVSAPVAPVETPTPVSAPLPTPAAASAEPAASGPVYQSQIPNTLNDAAIVPTAVFFPRGRDAEARSLAQKLETMTPKFTKVAFRLRVGVCTTYDPRGEWKPTILQEASLHPLRSIFLIAERPLDDARKRDLTMALEPQSIYFQDVPLAAIEKKAFYTDLLLGLVFFFDSLKPRP